MNEPQPTRPASSRREPISVAIACIAWIAMAGPGFSARDSTTPPVDPPQETPDSQPQPQPQAVTGVAVWALDCDIRVKDNTTDTNTRPAVTVTYNPDIVNETVTVMLQSTCDLDLDHAALSTPAPLAKSQTYTITLSELKPNIKAKIAITPGILTTPTEFATFGPKGDTKQTSLAKVYATPHGADATLLWISMNERATPLWLGVRDVDVIVQTQFTSPKHVLEINYTADTVADQIRAEVKSSYDIKMHHPALSTAFTLNQNQTYTFVFSNVKPGAQPKLEITPTILTPAVDCETWGSDASTTNGSVRVQSYASDAVIVWLSINGQSTAFTLGAP